MSKIKLIAFAFCLTLFSNLFSQKGKNGSLSVSTANVKINEFTALTSNAAVGNATITVAASSLNANGRFTGALAPGDLVMVIQMQGALIKLNPYNPWEAYVTDSLYGRIYSYQNCGNYEFAQVKTVISATQIELECGLKYDYSIAGRTQVVRVPRYNALNVTGTGTLTTDAWSGTAGIGGILAAEVDGNTTVNAGGIITATGLGFRGGLPAASGGTDFYPLSSATPANKGSEKGEGIGSNRLNNSIDSLGNYCKGAPGNGGGGGNANNCAGGGGGNGGVIANYNGHGNPGAGFNAIWNLEWPGKASVTSSGGGKGGYGTSTTNTTNINTVGPNSTLWGTFRRVSAGGFGGRPLDYSTGKLFIGGGGGAGHTTLGQSNGAGACTGGAGGGLIFLLNYGTISGTGSIVSNGNNGGNAYGVGNFANPQQGIDGAGGGGAGGTIILQCNGTISGITTSAIGGNGGNQVKSGTANSEGQGPGGGGGGGYIAGNGSVFTQNANGGINGTTNASAFDTEFPMNGATAGGAGSNNQVITPSFSLTASPNQTLCTNQFAVLTATSTNSSATVLWYNAAAGGNSIAAGTTYTTPVYATSGTYTVYAGSCPGIYRVPVIITVNTGATFAINSPTICSGQSTILTVTTTATSYTWSTPGSPTTNTISVSPTSTTIYNISGGTGGCVGSQTTQVTVNNTPVVSVPGATICSGNSATLTASGATNYTWMPGGQTTTSIIVTPTINTTYSITGANGSCTNSTTANVSITATPTISTNSTTICAGQIATFTVTGATSYTWNPGGVTGNTYTTSPASSGTVSVVGANGSCTAQLTTSVAVTPNPTVSVTNQTICPTQTITLTAGGATTYSWNTGPTTNTISVSPSSTTIYTVTGTSSLCSDTKTVSVIVATQPTVSVANASICSGSSTILTASGATNYTWSPGGQFTSTVSVSPTNTTTYTILGSNGTCTGTTTAIVDVTSTPTLIANSATICPGQTATLTVSGATSYTWNPGAITGPTYTIAPASNTTVSVIGANGTCTTSATVSVTIGTGISISVNNPTICPGATATLTATGATSYTWNTGPTTNTLSISPGTTTTYTVTGANGACTGSNTAVVTVESIPTLTTSASSTICAGQTVTLTVSGANTYTWEPGSLSGSSVAINPSANTTYTVVGSNGTCTNSATTSVALINCTNSCQFSLGRDTAFCSPMNYVINGPAGYNSYSWTPGGSTTQNITATNTGTYILTADMLSTDLVVNGAFTAGNTGFASNYLVPVIPGPFGLLSNPGTYLVTTNPNFGHTNFLSFGDHTTGTGNMMVCNGASTANDIVWTETITVSPNTNYNFSAWAASTENTSASSAAQLQFSINSVLIGAVHTPPLTGGVWSNFAVNWNSGASTSAVITIVDQNTAAGGNDFAIDDIFFQQVCSYSDTIVVTENSAPTLTVSTINSVICNGNSTSLTASGATTYTWTGGVTNGAAFSPTITTSYSVTGTSVQGCTNTAIQTITVNATPTVAVNSPSICSDAPGVGLNASGAFSYTWSTGTGNGNYQFVSPTATTVYTISGTGSNGCINASVTTATVFVTVMPTVTVNSPTICAGQTATLNANGATTYSWSTTETTSSINVSPATTNTYYVFGETNGCSNFITTTVSVIPSPTITATAGNFFGCSPFCTNFTDVVSPSATSVMYNFGDGTTGNANNPNHCYATGGSYTVTATVTNSVLGCSSTYTMPTIDVINSVVANFNITEGNVVTVGSEIHFINTSTNDEISFWTTSCAGEANPLANFDFNFTFADTGSCCIKLEATNLAGCNDTIEKCIKVVREAVVVIPNVFTPNGDGSNEVFKVISSGLKSLNCTIFDRWGLKIYEWDGINGYWDGNTKAGAAPDGTYFYIINYTDQLDKTTTEKGFLNLFDGR